MRVLPYTWDEQQSIAANVDRFPSDVHTWQCSQIWKLFSLFSLSTPPGDMMLSCARARKHQGENKSDHRNTDAYLTAAFPGSLTKTVQKQTFWWEMSHYYTCRHCANPRRSARGLCTCWYHYVLNHNDKYLSRNFFFYRESQFRVSQLHPVFSVHI